MALRCTNYLANRVISAKNSVWNVQRNFSKTGNMTTKVTPMPPMNEPVPGLPTPLYASVRKDQQTTKVTTLPNGIRVASESRFGEFCTIGVAVDSGSRYEVAYPSGISHFLEKLAFNSTVNYPDKDEMLIKLEGHGGICDSQASRDTFIYAASAYSSGLNDVMKLLGDVVLRPLITPDEVDAARQIIGFELQSLYMKPEQETLLMDMIHSAAYRDNTLGLPKLCPPGNINKIDRGILFKYLSQHYSPQRIVIGGVGVDHQKLCDAAQKYFVDEKPIWETSSDLINKMRQMSVDNSIAQYTGGIVQEECNIPQFAAAGLPELSHVMVGLEGCGHQHGHFIPLCVLNMMMGGGGSFSAGGPGKGMYTRLYTSVLNRYHWMYSATAYNHAYSDTGLFCIHASAPPTHMREMLEVIVRELVAMAGTVSDQELRRAKTQLQSMLLMNLESRPVVFEDIVRQVLATGHRKQPQHFIDEIEKITKEDIVEVARKMLSSQPSVAARGNLQKLPSLEYIQAGLLHTEGKVPSGRKLSLFR